MEPGNADGKRVKRAERETDGRRADRGEGNLPQRVFPIATALNDPLTVPLAGASIRIETADAITLENIALHM